MTPDIKVSDAKPLDGVIDLEASEDIDLEDTENVNLEEIVKWFLNQYKYLHEYRLQKLIYLAELIAIELDGSRLTSVDFKPYMYGSYSEELPDTLDGLKGEITVKPDMHHGKSVSVYRYNGDANIASKSVKTILEGANKISRSKSNEELAKWSKESWLYENTSFGETMNFDRYRQRLESDSAESDVRKLVES